MKMVDQSDELLDHILSADFCPQFDVYIDINTSSSSYQSTDFSFSSDPLEIDIKDELEKVLLPGSSKQHFIEQCDANNNIFSNKINSSKYWTVKEEVDGNEINSYSENMRVLGKAEDISHSMDSVMTGLRLQTQISNRVEVDGRLERILQLQPTKSHDRSVLHVSHQSSQGKVTKVRRGVSILKPKIRDSAAKVFRKKSLNTKCMMPNFEETLKSPQLKRSCVGGCVSKEDFEKEVKNHQERIRRRDLAMQREKLRNLLPNTLDKDKIGALKVLESAREYCLELQHKVAMSESQLKFEATWNKFLVRRLEGLQDLSKTEEEEVMLDNTGVCILP